MLDLFGTIVAAPSAAERAAALTQIARAAGVTYEMADTVYAESWAARHSRLATVSSLSCYLAARFGQPRSQAALARLLLSQSVPRLAADTSVLVCLTQLRAAGIRIGVLSDASADIAAAWPGCQLAALADTAVFSCQAGTVKPDHSLYREALAALRVPPGNALYCGDGGGDELRGATAAGMAAVRVDRRGGPGRLAYGESAWAGPVLAGIESLPALLELSRRQP